MQAHSQHGQHHGHGHHGHHAASPLLTSAQATIHCLVGCVVGELAGLAIGVSLGWNAWPTMIFATVLAYVSGLTLGLVPIVRSQGKSFAEAFKLIWIGEVTSIGVMEIAMNTVDYAIGGMQTSSVFSAIFWIGIAASIPAGFLAAWPVNWWLIRRDLKKCH